MSVRLSVCLAYITCIIVDYHFLTYPSPPGCDPNSWPNVDNGVVCGSCSALVNIGSYDTCNAYCAAQGMGCVNGWEENSDTCSIQFVAGCGYSFNSYGTSDAICECSVPTMTPTISPAPTITSAPTSVYHHPPEMKCMLDALSVDDSRWSPGGYVPTTLAGVDECATICSDHKYFGLQCPTSSGRVQCQCANSLTGSIPQPDSDCRGGTAHGQCMGPFTAGDYLLGGYERASVYSNHRTLFFVVVT